MSLVNGINPLRICHPYFFNEASESNTYSEIVEGKIAREVQRDISKLNWQKPLVQESITTIELITGCRDKAIIYKAFVDSRRLVQVALYAFCVHMNDPVILKIRKIYSHSRGFDLGKPLQQAYHALLNLFVKAMDGLSRNIPKYYDASSVDYSALTNVTNHRVACDLIESVFRLSVPTKEIETDKIWNAYNLIIH